MIAADLAQALGGKRSGRSFLCKCPAHGDRTASLSIMDGERAPLLKCFAGCNSTDVIDALRRLGLWNAPTHADAGAKGGRGKKASDNITSFRGTAATYTLKRLKREQRIDAAHRVWHASGDPRGTLAERYLNARRIELPIDLCGRVLRFHPACPWGSSGAVPALVAAFQPINEPDDDAPPTAILRVGLNGDGTKIGRKMLGPVGGCAIKLDADESVSLGLGIAEGLETALTVRATGWRPMWCLGSAGAIKTFPVLTGIEALTVFADHDPTGLTAAQICAERWQAAGCEAFIRTPREAGADWADLS